MIPLFKTLQNGNLTNQAGQMGQITQIGGLFEFEQAGETNPSFTPAFSICANGTLALDESAIWYSCQPDDDPNDLYTISPNPLCWQVYINTIPCDCSNCSTTASPVASTSAVAPVTVTASVSTSVPTNSAPA